MHRQMRLRLTKHDMLQAIWNRLSGAEQRKLIRRYASLIAKAARVEHGAGKKGSDEQADL